LKIGPERTPRAILEEAKVRAKKVIEEAQAEAVRIKANAHAA
jgi:cell division septum initiation protein DivIVA